ncbi:MAG: prepilin-type N-terminal cleavage/methylation domain-containing protein, partial [Perlucidibaca sp.]
MRASRLPGQAGRGFTLIEVLMALAIFGVVSLMLLGQSRDQVRMAAGLEDRLIAHWVALNTLTLMAVHMACIST